MESNWSEKLAPNRSRTSLEVHTKVSMVSGKQKRLMKTHLSNPILLLNAANMTDAEISFKGFCSKKIVGHDDDTCNARSKVITWRM
jgi:hypothetical protein